MDKGTWQERSNHSYGAKLAALGSAIDGPALDKTTSLAAGFFDESEVDRYRVVRDGRYGPHPRHTLDVFADLDTEGPRPVLVFVHGGGFSGGDKSLPGQPFYENVGNWAVSFGITCVTINYRLAPEFGWPAAREDISRAIDWIQSNIAALGGDANKIFLMGHSAGATHVADFAANCASSLDQRGVRGLVVVSGLYDIAPVSDMDQVKRYYGSNQRGYEERSALSRIGECKTPTLVVVAEHEPPSMQRQAFRLVEKLFDIDEKMPSVALIRGHNHFSVLLTLGHTSGTQLDHVIKDFIISI